MTAILRHTAAVSQPLTRSGMTSLLSCRREPSYRDSFAVSLDPANKQRDDDCRLAINIKKFTKRKKRQKKPRGYYPL